MEFAVRFEGDPRGSTKQVAALGLTYGKHTALGRGVEQREIERVWSRRGRRGREARKPAGYLVDIAFVGVARRVFANGFGGGFWRFLSRRGSDLRFHPKQVVGVNVWPGMLRLFRGRYWPLATHLPGNSRAGDMEVVSGAAI